MVLLLHESSHVCTRVYVELHSFHSWPHSPCLGATSLQSFCYQHHALQDLHWKWYPNSLSMPVHSLSSPTLQRVISCCLTMAGQFWPKKPSKHRDHQLQPHLPQSSLKPNLGKGAFLPSCSFRGYASSALGLPPESFLYPYNYFPIWFNNSLFKNPLFNYTIISLSWLDSDTK